VDVPVFPNQIEQYGMVGTTVYGDLNSLGDKSASSGSDYIDYSLGMVSAYEKYVEATTKTEVINNLSKAGVLHTDKIKLTKEVSLTTPSFGLNTVEQSLRTQGTQTAKIIDGSKETLKNLNLVGDALSAIYIFAESAEEYVNSVVLVQTRSDISS